MAPTQRRVPHNERRALIERAIDAEPERAEHYLALGDVLQEEGDPHGELVALQAQRDDALADALLARHGDRLLGLSTKARAPFTLEWKLGFVRRVRLSLPRGRRREVARPLTALLEAPALRFLRVLELGALRHPRFGELVEVLGGLRLPSLRSLSLATFCAPDEGRISDVTLGPLAALSAAAPRLETLVVQGHDFDLEGLELPSLRTLDLRLGQASPRVLDALSAPAFRGLEHLRVFVSFSHHAKGLAALARALSNLEGLRSLSLRYGPSSEAAVEVVLGARLPALCALDITGPRVSQASLEALAQRRQHLPALESVTCLVEGPPPTLAGLSVRAPDDLEPDDEAQHPDVRPSRSVRCWRSIRASHAAVLRGDGLLAFSSAERARVLALELDEPLVVGTAHTSCAEALRALGRLTEGLAESALAVSHLDPDHPEPLARALHVHGMMACDLGRRDEGRRALERALELHRRAKRREGEAYVLQSLALDADAAQDYATARTLLERAQKLAAKGKLTALTGHLERALSLNAQRRGAYDEALARLSADTSDEPRVVAQNLTNTGTLHWQRGALDEAEQCYRQALALAKHHRLPRQEAFAEVNLGHLFTSRADAASAIAHLDRAIALFRAQELPSAEASALCTLADAHLIANDGAAAERTTLQAMTLAKATQNRTCESTANKILSDLALNDWQGARALQYAQASLAIDRQLGAGHAEGQALCWGKVSFAHVVLGDFDAAHEAAQRALELRGGPGPLMGWSQLGLALLEFARGRLERAVTACDAALGAARPDDSVLRRRIHAYRAASLARLGNLRDAARALEASATEAPATTWDAQSKEQLEVCRAVVEHARRLREGGDVDALLTRLHRPVSYEGRLFYERLVNEPVLSSSRP